MSIESRALKIDTDGSITEFQVSLTYPEMNNKMFGEDRLVERVSAIGLEAWNVYRPDGAKRAVMLVDESGLYHPDYKVNTIASILYGCLQHGQEIKGPVYLVCESHDDFVGLHKSFTTETVESLVGTFLPIKVARFTAKVLG